MLMSNSGLKKLFVSCNSTIKNFSSKQSQPKNFFRPSISQTCTEHSFFEKKIQKYFFIFLYTLFLTITGNKEIFRPHLPCSCFASIPLFLLESGLGLVGGDRRGTTRLDLSKHVEIHQTKRTKINHQKIQISHDPKLSQPAPFFSYNFRYKWVCPSLFTKYAWICYIFGVLIYSSTFNSQKVYQWYW